MINYPAIIELDADGKSYNVRFPDLEGCLTYGSTKKEALENAQEALSLYLESLDSRAKEIPNSSKLSGENISYVSPERCTLRTVFRCASPARPHTGIQRTIKAGKTECVTRST